MFYGISETKNWMAYYYFKSHCKIKMLLIIMEIYTKKQIVELNKIKAPYINKYENAIMKSIILYN